MLVKDEEKNLPKCLESIRGLFDERVLIGATGCTATRQLWSDSRGPADDVVWASIE